MAKASLTLQSGTIVTIEGTAGEINELIALYDSARSRSSTGQSRGDGPASVPTSGTPSIEDGREPTGSVDLAAIVNHVKSCEEAELIGKNILDKSDRVPQVLLPLYIVHEHMGNVAGLTSGDVSKVTAELGIRIGVPNASTMLSGS